MVLFYGLAYFVLGRQFGEASRQCAAHRARNLSQTTYAVLQERLSTGKPPVEQSIATPSAPDLAVSTYVHVDTSFSDLRAVLRGLDWVFAR